ncbi:AAA family ATPase [Flavobacterium sp.]|uniref:AAA family ATPase n=1 Tax=Flavobacterium sp. TaxID=239 RepID=UPI0038FC1917
MIKKIDIDKFGLFENFKWDIFVGRNETFRRLNIIYGRNYSGKTTLSRILNSIFEKHLPLNYENGNFTVAFSDGSSITQNNLATVNLNYNLRVYNSDFVKTNLSWLHKDDGTISPFTILGSKNIEIDAKIKEIDALLGKLEENNGLLFDQQELLKTYNFKKNESQSNTNELDTKLTDKARDIKNNAPIYNVPTYQIRTIKGDIQESIKQGELAPEEITELKKLLKEEEKKTITSLQEIKPDFGNQLNQVNELLKKQIKPSEPILELVNNSLLQEWARQGIDKHKGLRDTCGFCGNPINENLWEKLDAHFSKESEELRKEIKLKIDKLEQSKVNLSEFFNLSKDDFYSNLHSEFDTLQKQWSSATKTYIKSIDILISELSEREKDIFKAREISNISDVSESILETIIDINKLIKEHSNKSLTLKTDQNKARVKLRYSEIAKFLTTINYQDKVLKIEKLEADEVIAKKAYDETYAKVELLNEEKRTLEAQSKDESKGAELVNQHLTHFFGHSELKLIAEGSAPNILFRIVRENGYANNLSEGECSLISFCYFIAKMEDELKDELNSDKLIIYIDDPISSLDSNHIFFMFSLIESIIAKPKKYCQLFISTHNLDFLKYLKQLTYPTYKPQPNSKDKADKNQFLIERKSKSSSILKLSPEYLKKYITEFNYLFYQIYTCSSADLQNIEHNFQYNFGNNMRKFLEAFLFYKYPSNKMSFDQRIKKYFDNDEIAFNLVKRVINEFSHLEDNFDRSIEPIDINVIQSVSSAVMQKMQATDKDQFDALKESIENESEVY